MEGLQPSKEPIHPPLTRHGSAVTAAQQFVKCTLDAKGDLYIRLHKTDIVIVRANGAVQLTTGGWFTVSTQGSMNDVLRVIDFTVRSSAV